MSRRLSAQHMKLNISGGTHMHHNDPLMKTSPAAITIPTRQTPFPSQPYRLDKLVQIAGA